MLKRSAVLLLCVLLASCGGGGGAPTSIPTVAQPHTAGQAQIHITIPAGSSTGSTAKRRDFVGSDAQGLTVGVTPQGGTQTVASYALDGTACTTVSGGRSCVVVVQAPFGVDTFTIELFDAAPVGGVIPTTAHLLGQATDANVSIEPGVVVPVIALYVAAQIGSIGLAASSAMLTFAADGTAHSGGVIITPTDFGDQPITTGPNAPYLNPITATLTETGGSGHTQLTLSGTPSGTSVTLTQSSQTLGVSYDGGGASGYYATVTLSASGATSESFTVVPMHVTTTSPYFSGGAVTFTAASQSASFSVSEPLGSNSYGASLSAGCVAAVSGTGSGSSGTVILGSTGAAAAPCAMNVTDGLGASYAIPYTTTISSLGGVTIGGVTEYAIASPANARAEAITAGPDGNIYVGEDIGNDIDQFTTAGSYTQFLVPTSNASPGSLIAGTDGAIWFVEKGSYKIGRMALSGTFTEYALPNFTQSFPQGLTVGSDGNLYVLDRGNQWIVKITPQGTVLAEFPLPTNVTPGLFGIVTGADGRLYVADEANDQIDAVTTSGSVSTYPIPTTGAGVTNLIAGPNGDIWFTESNAQNLGSMTTGGSFVEYPIGQSDSPTGLTTGPDGNVWFCAAGTNSIGRFNVTTHAFSHVAIPSASASPAEIVTGSDGNLWFTEFNTNKVGKFTP